MLSCHLCAPLSQSAIVQGSYADRDKITGQYNYAFVLLSGLPFDSLRPGRILRLSCKPVIIPNYYELKNIFVIPRSVTYVFSVHTFACLWNINSFSKYRNVWVYLTITKYHISHLSDSHCFQDYLFMTLAKLILANIAHLSHTVYPTKCD